MDAEVLKPQIYDLSGKPANIPEDQIPEALASGKYAFPKGAKIPVLNPDGEPGVIPAEQAHDAFKVGYSFDAPSSQLDRIKTEQYSGALPGAMAAATGAARGATLGLSDQALAKSGLVRAQELSDLQKYRPGWSMAGEAAGIIADPVGVMGAVGKLGHAVAEGAQAAKIAELAKEGSTAAKVLGAAQDIGATALGSAAEGAIFGLGNSVTEQALGDPDLNGEKVLANVGHGALFGGAVGALLKGAAIGVPESVKAASGALEKLRDIAIGTGEKDAGLLGKVLPEGKLSEAIANRRINLDQDGQIGIVHEATDELNTANKNINTALKDLNKEIRPQEAEAMINPDPTKAKEFKNTFFDKMNSTIETMEARPRKYSGKVADDLSELRDELVNTAGNKTSVEEFNTLKEMKQKLNSINSNIVYSETSKDTKALLQGVRNAVNDALKNPEIFGETASRLAEHDSTLQKFYEFVAPYARSARGATEFQKAFGSFDKRGTWNFDPKKVELVFKRGNTLKGQEQMKLLDEYHQMLKELPEHIKSTYENVPNGRTFDEKQLSNIIDNSEKTALDSHQKYLASISNKKSGLGIGDLAAASIATSHPIIGAAIEAYNVYKNPIGAMNKLAEVERIIGKTTNIVGKASKAIFDTGIKVGELGRQSAIKLSAEDRLEEHQELQKKLTALNNNPSEMIDKIAAHTEELGNTAPKIAQSVGMASTRAAQFLASKLPSPPNSNPFTAAYEPSQAEISQFDRYADIVQKPTLALSQVKDGTLVPETIETLATVYPKLYDHMKQAVLKEATNVLAKKEAIPYQTKQSISMFLGQPLEQSMLPQVAMANQQAYISTPQAPPMSKQRPSKSGMKDLTLASRTSLTRQDQES